MNFEILIIRIKTNILAFSTMCCLHVVGLRNEVVDLLVPSLNILIFFLILIFWRREGRKWGFEISPQNVIHV
jgi:hypothetical protein